MIEPFDQVAYDAEADAYFAALDYAYDSIGVTKQPIVLPRARVVRKSWWRRALWWLL